MIKGLTDQVVLRRDGKIRAGTRDPVTNFPKNSPFFILKDAPQLAPVLGNEPTEIYFTVHSDQLDQFFRDDLRWYTKSEIVCKSMHGYKNPANNEDMGSVAAFFKVGQEVSGLKKEQFPGMTRAFQRACMYKQCPNYIKGECSEHMFLDIMIPQYSMGAVFTLTNTSINAVLNAMSTFQKAYFCYQGKFSGQIFRLYKKKEPINFPDKNGNMSKRDTDIVHLENVSFADYESKFRSQINPVDWDALMYMRSRQTPGLQAQISASPGLPMLDGDVDGIETSEEVVSAAPTSSLAKAEAQVDSAKDRGNDPTVAPLFAEISSLLGKENSEEARTATAKNFPDVKRLHDYLAGRIKDMKKAQKAAKPGTAKTVVAKAAPAAAAPAATSAPAPAVLDGPPLY